jgi:hypothetical protein
MAESGAQGNEYLQGDWPIIAEASWTGGIEVLHFQRKGRACRKWQESRNVSKAATQGKGEIHDEE